MAIVFSPPAIIYLNPDSISEQVLSVFVRQLFITQVLDAAAFDGYVAMDGYYTQRLHQDGYRVLVLRDLHDQTNRNLADIVLFGKVGLVSVLVNKVGPPGLTLPINQVYLTALITKPNVGSPLVNFPFVERPDIDDGFVGELDNDDFNPHHLDPPIMRNAEPVD